MIDGIEIKKRIKARKKHYGPKVETYTLVDASYKKYYFTAAVIFCVLSFAGGIGFTLATKYGEANNGPEPQGQVLGASAPVPLMVGPLLPQQPISLQTVANTTIGKLKDYMEGPSTEEELLIKKDKLKEYLEYKKSPFAKDDAALETLVHSPHMKLILEIAFAESSLGKKCVDNNCSNIGSAPDRPYWHQYKSLSNWILDFNRLLERRYKDWTLREMCGVYVQPCNENWLIATNEIRQELIEWEID